MIKEEEYERIKAEIEKRQKNSFICLQRLYKTPHLIESAVDFERTSTHLHNVCETYETLLTCLNKELDWNKLCYEMLITSVKICHKKRELEKLETSEKILCDFNNEFTGGKLSGTIRH